MLRPGTGRGEGCEAAALGLTAALGARGGGEEGAGGGVPRGRPGASDTLRMLRGPFLSACSPRGLFGILSSPWEHKPAPLCHREAGHFPSKFLVLYEASP